MKELMKKEKGITLIALVVTIIVLLILAGVSIQMLTGQTGILKNAEEARGQTEIGQVKDYIQQSLLAKMIENNGEGLTAEQFYEVITEYFDGVPALPEDGESYKGTKWENFPENFPEKLTTKKEYGEHEIEIGDIYSGTLSGTETPPIEAGDMGGNNLKNFQGEFVDIGLDINDKNETYDDWELFYVGNESGENRIFLIAADYVPVSKLTNWGIIGAKGTLTEDGSYGLQTYDKTADGGSYPYCVRWASSSTSTLKIPWMELPTTPTNFMKLVKHTGYKLEDSKTKNNNATAVSQLLNTGVWSPIKDNAKEKNKIEFAIGGSTLEMWCAAWNASNPTEGGFTEVYANGKGSTGYYVGNSTEATKTYYYMNGVSSLSSTELGKLESNYPTFFPHTSVINNCSGYWLASPSAFATTTETSLAMIFYSGNVGNFLYGGSVSTGYTSLLCGVRPVVCLTTTTKLKKNEKKSDDTKIVYDLV